MLFNYYLTLFINLSLLVILTVVSNFGGKNEEVTVAFLNKKQC